MKRDGCWRARSRRDNDPGVNKKADAGKATGPLTSATGKKKGAKKVAPAADAQTAPSLYSGWFNNIVERLDGEFTKIRSVYNIERGEEFEVALCRALRDLLPDRFGVCRGYAVEISGQLAGDDIIVYDASRFPTLRGLGRTPEVKEHVPAEAVLAYIEAKHTIYAQQKVPVANKGQSMVKACDQVAAVKRLRRQAVPLEAISPRMHMPKGMCKQRPGFPDIRNPWYGAVWALNIVVENDADPATAVSSRVNELLQAGTARSVLPDVIAAGSVMLSPALLQPDGHHHTRPFVTNDTQLLSTNGVRALGVAVMHLTWAIEDIMLGDIPWAHMLHAQLASAENEHGDSIILPSGASVQAAAPSAQTDDRPSSGSGGAAGLPLGDGDAPDDGGESS